MIINDDRQGVPLTFLHWRVLQVLQPRNLNLNLSGYVRNKNDEQAIGASADRVDDHRGDQMHAEDDFVGRAGLSIEEHVVSRIDQRFDGDVVLVFVFGQEREQGVMRQPSAVQENGAQGDQLSAERSALEHDGTVTLIVHRSPISLDVFDAAPKDGPSQTKVNVLDRGGQTETDGAEEAHFRADASCEEDEITRRDQDEEQRREPEDHKDDGEQLFPSGDAVVDEGPYSYGLQSPLSHLQSVLYVR